MCRTKTEGQKQHRSLCITGAEVPRKWDDITNIVHSEYGLEKPLEPESKSAMGYGTKATQIQVPVWTISYMILLNI